MNTSLKLSLAVVVIITLITAKTDAADRTKLAPSNVKLPDRVSFNAHIRPIMSNTCFTCHGPDEEANDSGFHIDSFEGATSELPSDESLVGIKPRDPESSEVYLRITGRGDGGVMPPLEFRHQLTDYDKALFRRWIEQGAQYQQHWSYAPIHKPDIPKIDRYTDEITSPVDAFILDRLNREGIEPSPIADKSTLLRRLSLDLIGLPPTPAELADFEKDDSPHAYARQVERLLASAHFGERMATSWLDVVRFADTVGYHGDQNMHVFPYRDYVINAFNNNMPFDQFTREQIAGDLLPGATADQLTATGLLRLNMVTREGGAQPKEYLAKYKADRVRMIGTAWLGSTLACCECHNHKYDPFTTKDFYSIGAFFDDLQQWGVYSDYGYTRNPDLQGFNNDYPFPPEMRVESESLGQEIAALQRQRDARLSDLIDDAASKISMPSREAIDQWTATVGEHLSRHPAGWIPLMINDVTTDNKTKAIVLDDQSILLRGDTSKGETIAIRAGVDNSVLVNSIRVEVIPDETHDGRVGRGEDGRFELNLTAVLRELNSDQQTTIDSSMTLDFSVIQADRRNPRRYRSGDPPVSVQMPWRSGPAVHQLPHDETRLAHTAVFHLKRPAQLTPDMQIEFAVASGDVGRIRLSVTPLADAIAGWPAADATALAAVQTSADLRTKAQQDIVKSLAYRALQPENELDTLAKYYREQILAGQSGLAMTVVAQSIDSQEIPVSRVLPRGNWQDETGELAPPDTPNFLPKQPVDGVQRRSRLDLADWLVSKQNPLVPRHFVNRMWKQFFGSGLSGKLDDLGNQGEWPSHPLLLDWLAADFRDNAWNVKNLVRQIVLSRTYRQSAAVRSDLAEIDPYNRLLAQQSARRLEAEIVRDNALAIAGLLDTSYTGGPSVFPFQPAGHYKNLQFPNRVYRKQDDFRQYRRGLYMHWQRTFLHPMLVNFDAPARDECTADRTVSNSPQQALTLLNDPEFVEASVAMAIRLAASSQDRGFDHRLQTAFRLALARSTTPREAASLKALYERQLAYYDANPAESSKLLAVLATAPSIEPSDSASLAAWSQVCRVILNLHETITRY